MKNSVIVTASLIAFSLAGCGQQKQSVSLQTKSEVPSELPHVSYKSGNTKVSIAASDILTKRLVAQLGAEQVRRENHSPFTNSTCKATQQPTGWKVFCKSIGPIPWSRSDKRPILGFGVSVRFETGRDLSTRDTAKIVFG